MTRFAHISDTHIRNVKYQEEYRIVFKELYESLENYSIFFLILYISNMCIANVSKSSHCFSCV